MKHNVKLYKVGGCVRDEILGLPIKDVDYAVEAPSFEAMEEYIRSKGGRVYLSKPEFFTSRAKVWGLDADFVLCRRERGYSDGRRPDLVEVGTIDDDLARRDFTMNAIAIKLNEDGTEGEVYDPFNGREDILNRTIRCVGNPEDRFAEDSLRILRAIRFSITKDFGLEASVAKALWEPEIVKKLANVSIERVREELLRCFKHSTPHTLMALNHFPMVRDIVFDKNKLWLKPTLED
jgi:tRNA nucleotidyltransferase (CCA-adding enzyme)